MGAALLLPFVACIVLIDRLVKRERIAGEVDAATDFFVCVNFF